MRKNHSKKNLWALFSSVFRRFLFWRWLNVSDDFVSNWLWLGLGAFAIALRVFGFFDGWPLGRVSLRINWGTVILVVQYIIASLPFSIFAQPFAAPATEATVPAVSAFGACFAGFGAAASWGNSVLLSAGFFATWLVFGVFLLSFEVAGDSFFTGSGVFALTGKGVAAFVTRKTK